MSPIMPGDIRDLLRHLGVMARHAEEQTRHAAQVARHLETIATNTAPGARAPRCWSCGGTSFVTAYDGSAAEVVCADCNATLVAVPDRDDHAPMSVREARGEIIAPATRPTPQPVETMWGEPMIVMPRAVIVALASALGEFAWGEPDGAPHERDLSIGLVDADRLADALHTQWIASRFLDAAERATMASYGSWRDE